MTSSRDSCERRIRGFVTAAAVVGGLLAGIAPVLVMSAEPFDSNTDMGALRLQLGLTTYTSSSTTLPKTHDPAPPRFVYETKGKPTRAGFEQLTEQVFVPTGKCATSLDESATAVKLAKLTPGPVSFPLGIGPDSLGVFDGPKGVACYRISAGPGEWIQFEIGPDLKTLGARSFYRLELDIEVKQGARFELQVLRGGAHYGTPWILESGSSISGGASTSQGARHWACTARSDSGPDAGSADNCRWVINDLGDGFTLKATAGEGSWEGGGDWGVAAYDKNSIIYLTDAEVGVLGCSRIDTGATGDPYTSTIGDGINSAQCAVTRVDPTNYGGTCSTNIAYLFRTVPVGVGGCELAKNEGEQMAAVIDVVFPPEPNVPLNSKDPTVIQFPVPSSTGLVAFDIPRCKGTLVRNANGDTLSDDPTIAEVLADPPPEGWTSVDVISGGKIEWACILEDEEDFLGKDKTGTGELMRVRQKILFWGDPIIIRQKE